MKRPTLLAIAAAVVLSASAYARDSYQTQMQSALEGVERPADFNVSAYLTFETLQNGDPRLLDFITPGLRNAPPSDLKTLMGGETRLTAANYSAVIDRLFLGDDVASYKALRGAEATREQTDTLKAEIEKSYKTCQNLPETMTHEAFSQFLDMFNIIANIDGAGFTGEGVRKYLIASASFVQLEHGSKLTQDGLLQLSEFIALLYHYLNTADANRLDAGQRELLTLLKGSRITILTSYSNEKTTTRTFPEIPENAGNITSGPGKGLHSLIPGIDDYFSRARKILTKTLTSRVELEMAQQRLHDGQQRLQDSQQRLQETNKRFDDLGINIAEEEAKSKILKKQLKESNEKLKESNEKLKESNEKVKESNEKLKESNEQLKEDKEIIKGLLVLNEFVGLAQKELKGDAAPMSKNLMIHYKEAKKAFEDLKKYRKSNSAVEQALSSCESIFSKLEKMEK
ncbi:MAG: hypothetical protein AB7S65_13255 [Sulfuricurvum sp.]